MRKLLVFGIVLGTILTLSPLFGILGTVFGMTRAFQSLGNSSNTDPHLLSERIGTSLVSTAAGLFFCPFGIVILTLSLVFHFRIRKSCPPSLPDVPSP